MSSFGEPGKINGHYYPDKSKIVSSLPAVSFLTSDGQKLRTS